MTETLELSFDVIDDLLWASSKGRLDTERPMLPYSASRIGPFVELQLQINKDPRHEVIEAHWIDYATVPGFKSALAGRNAFWLDDLKMRGIMRTSALPHSEHYSLSRTSFLMAARKAAEGVGFSVATAQLLTAAVREMESNIHEHSAAAGTGVVAFQAVHSAFEFLVADAGVGVLSTLREAEEYKGLTDHGRALHTALQNGSSRFGKAANRGRGFDQLFLSLVSMNGDLRFRTGDHALVISGPNPNLKISRLLQKPFYQGFFASVRLELSGASASMR
jgi:hypothetical protein